MATKADLEARVAELESQLAASTSDPRAAGMTRLVGMLKAVKDIGAADSSKRSVSALLVNSTRQRLNGNEVNVDLPLDVIVATDNGTAIASEIAAIAAGHEWARVAISGYWTTYGEISSNERGFPMAKRRQLRAQRIEVLNAAPLAAIPESDAPDLEPSSDVPF